MDNRITLHEIEIETSLGVTISFDEDLDIVGTSHPIEWSDETFSGDEFLESETMDDAILAGRIDGAKSEAREILAKEFSTENKEFSRSDIEQMTLSDVRFSLNSN